MEAVFCGFLQDCEMWIKENHAPDNFDYEKYTSYIEKYNVRFTAFLDAQAKHANATYIWLKALSFFSQKKHEAMKTLLHQLNNGASHMLLGYYYWFKADGKKETNDYETAYLHFKKAYNNGNYDAAFYICQYLAEQKYTMPQILHTCDAAIKAKNITALIAIAGLYKTMRKYYNAKKYYMAAYKVNCKNTVALLHFGNYYGDIEKKYDMMVKMYKKAAERGDDIAITLLGKYYDTQSPTPELAEGFYKTAADDYANTEAMIYLGEYYMARGKIAEMHTYYDMAIREGSTAAMIKKGDFYNDWAASPQEAEKFYRLAADRNDAFALLKIGKLREKEEKYDEMKTIYNELIAKGNDLAAVHLGSYYFNIERKEELAHALMDIAINLNNVEAHYLKASFLQKKMISCGRVVMNEEIIYYYNEAIEKNHSVAMNNLALYYFDLNINTKQMIKLYEKAISLKNLQAMNNLGYYYYSVKNYKQMKKYYGMAIKHGNLFPHCYLAKYYLDVEKNDAKFITHCLCGIYGGELKPYFMLEKYCGEIEKNPRNLLRYIRGPILLSLIICVKRKKLFMPVELYELIIVGWLQ